jgi:bifunctional non-homologous end joining protein LigD
MAAKLVAVLPQGDEWIYEVKLDGYRALILKDGDTIELRSRNDKNLSATYPRIVGSAAEIKAHQAVVDGEIVALDDSGRPSFQVLQHRMQHDGHRIVFYAFDLLHLNGKDLVGQPLSKRRAQLHTIIEDCGLLLSLDLPGTPEDIVTAVRGLGLEGVIAKRKDSVYEPGERSGAWQKLKLELQQEFVVGGFRPGSFGFDSLLLGYYDGRELKFAGKVRAGFVPHVRRDISATLKALQIEHCPFGNLPDPKRSRWGSGVTIEDMREMQWVQPQLVVEVRFVEWTAEGRLRHAVFVGKRPDKRAREVSRERPSRG